VVFPDFKYVEQVPVSREGANHLFEQHLEPSLGRSGAKQATLKSWVLPWKAVILLCKSTTSRVLDGLLVDNTYSSSLEAALQHCPCRIVWFSPAFPFIDLLFTFCLSSFIPI
jgi:hypothetical protein